MRIECQEAFSAFEDIICECSALNRTVAIDQSLWTAGCEQADVGVHVRISVAVDLFIP